MSVILGGLILILVGVIYEGLHSSTTELIDDGSCTNSIVQRDGLIQSKMAFGLVGKALIKFRELPALNCPTYVSKVKTDDPKKVEKFIAQQMLACHQRFSEKHLFMETSGRFCHVCNIIDFEDGLANLNVKAYLKENEASNQKGDTYWTIMRNPVLLLPDDDDKLKPKEMDLLHQFLTAEESVDQPITQIPGSRGMILFWLTKDTKDISPNRAQVEGVLHQLDESWRLSNYDMEEYYATQNAKKFFNRNFPGASFVRYYTSYDRETLHHYCKYIPSKQDYVSLKSI